MNTISQVPFWQLAKPQKLLIEKVARAICQADGRSPNHITCPRGSTVVLAVAIQEWENFIPHAIAAIEVIGDD